ncbi:MAG: T9SS type A sorting domain-containing protein [Adhaeribacter sp.]
MGKVLTGICCFLTFIAFSGLAQTLTPLESYPLVQVSPHHGKLLRTLAEGDTLKLPFFDDFAAYTGAPSPTNWLPGGGVYINNQFGLKPPSLHVATFDGVNGRGLPYSAITSYGYTDTLSSKPIDLGGLQAGDSLYLSFFWQAGGLGGSPNLDRESQPSFLALEFKDPQGNWVEAWRQPGTNLRTDFAQVMIRLAAPAYFYDGFQFRFRSAGVRKGNEDSWNVDYVFLDKNRRRANPHRTDVALNQHLNPLLERYTAMPAHQFFVRPAEELNDSAFTRLNNFNASFAPITWRGYVKVLSPAAPADTFLRGNAALQPQVRDFLINGKPNAAALTQTSTTLQVRHALFLTSRETDALLRANDTVARITTLGEYYAYDDGTAETNFSLNNSGNRQLAYRFDLNQDDHVRAIRVYLSKTNVPGHVITFRVWDELNGEPAPTVKASRSFAIPEVDQLNQFFDIVLTNPVPVSGSFYIGFSLPAAVPDFVNIGYDLNERAPGRIRYNNNSTGWLTFQEQPGALLLRPMMGLVTGIDDDLAAGPDLKVFPNPGPGLFTIAGDYRQLCLTDLSGKVVRCQTRLQAGDKLDLRHLAKGLYLLQFQLKDRTVSKKLVIY